MTCRLSTPQPTANLVLYDNAKIHEIVGNSLHLDTFESNKRFVVAKEVDADSMEIYLVSYLKYMAIRNNGHGWMEITIMRLYY